MKIKKQAAIARARSVIFGINRFIIGTVTGRIVPSGQRSDTGTVNIIGTIPGVPVID
jgi:hypothetical protein